MRTCTWQYLQKHSALLEKRGSSIYRGRPPFSIFGVGDYSFSPWKVAISGLYKKLEFVIVGNVNGKPIVLDDTCYFLPCQTEDEARFLVSLLKSAEARDAFAALIFWDAKRPITADILKRVNLAALARSQGFNESQLKRFPNFQPVLAKMAASRKAATLFP